MALSYKQGDDVTCICRTLNINDISHGREWRAKLSHKRALCRIDGSNGRREKGKLGGKPSLVTEKAEWEGGYGDPALPLVADSLAPNGLAPLSAPSDMRCCQSDLLNLVNQNAI